MKHKSLLFLLLAMLTSTTLQAYDAKINGIYYNFSGDEATVTYKESRTTSLPLYISDYSGSVVIPISVTYKGKNYNVTSIGYCAFYQCTGLTSVTIPNSVTTIDSYAFYKCTGLTSVTIPNSVTTIGHDAFYQCRGLTSVTIPNSVTSLSGFTYCTGLTSITIPNSVTSIGNSAFSYCSGLTSVTIPNSVTSIGYAAFFSCRRLTSITIPNSVTSIGSSAFADCSSLTSVTIPNSVTSIVDDTFNSCSNLTSITIPNSVTSIGNKAFRKCTSLTSVTIPNSVTSIGLEAFLECSSLTSVTIGNSVTSIGSKAFQRCSSLTSVTIPNSVTTIGSNAFESCNNLSSVTFHCETINNWFRELSSIQKVIIGNEVTEIVESAFPEAVTIYTSLGKSLLALWKAGYEDIQEIGSGTAFEKPELSLKKTTPSSLTISINKLIPEFLNKLIITYYAFSKAETQSMELNSNSDEIIFRGLQPDCYHYTSLVLSIDDATYTESFSFKTASLKFTTQQPKIISLGNVIVGAESNLEDEETNVGFEWRRTDWTSDFASNEAVGYLYDGMMEGYIRNINTEKLWKYRPYYEADSGNRYYGDWVGIDPTNTSYFEPTVHTYATITVTGNKAEVKGYAMRGTDRVTSQGFMYWENSSSYSLRKSGASIPANATVVEVSGNVMNATLEDLEYETTYCYVAFVKTEENETFFGEVQTFSTDIDPDGIDAVHSSESIVHGEEDVYDLSGRKIANGQFLDALAPRRDCSRGRSNGQMPRGINIIRMSDGSVRKILRK